MFVPRVCSTHSKCFVSLNAANKIHCISAVSKSVVKKLVPGTGDARCVAQHAVVAPVRTGLGVAYIAGLPGAWADPPADRGAVPGCSPHKVPLLALRQALSAAATYFGLPSLADQKALPGVADDGGDP